MTSTTSLKKQTSSRCRRISCLYGLMMGCMLITAAEGADFYVAPHGSDSAAGSMDAPFATLERARDEMRLSIASNTLDLVNTVFLREGVHERTTTFELGAADSAPDGHLIVYRAYPGESVRISGGKQLDGSQFSLVDSNDPIWSRVDVAARGHLWQSDLSAQGVTDLGVMLPAGWRNSSNGSAAELYVDGERMQLGRWPNGRQYVNIASKVSETAFTYSDPRPERWSAATDMWVHGLFYNYWADNALAATSIDTATKRITLSGEPNYGIKAGQPYFVFNLLEEIDVAGEYYIDRGSNMLYFWPITSDLPGADIMLSGLDDTMISIAGVRNMVILDLDIAGGRKTGVVISDSQNVTLSHCSIRNMGVNGVNLAGSRRCVLDRCEITNTGGTACNLSGGDRATLLRSDCVVKNCSISAFGLRHFMYNPGIRFSTVGATITHNNLFNGPHSAVLFGGNDNDFSLNNVYDVGYWSGDAGAIYGGRSWVNRGNRLFHNFIHDVATVMTGSSHGVHGVYFDDCISGNEVFGNTLYKVQKHALFNGGGRDNIWEHNVIAKCGTGHYTDTRGLTRMTTNGDSWDLLNGARLYDYQRPPWSDAYPELAAIPDDHAELGPYKLPGGTVFSRNIGWQNSSWVTVSGSATSYYKDYSGNVSNTDPGFVDESALNLKLRDDSPAYSISGFKTIPFEEIGPEPIRAPVYTHIGVPSFTTNSVTIQGLVDSGSWPWSEATFFWDSEDKGTSATEWTGSQSVLVSASGEIRMTLPDEPARARTGRMRVVSDFGTFWSDPLTLEPFPGAWNTEVYRHKLDITIPGHTGAPLKNFPVLVKLGEGLTGFSYNDFSDWNGADLRFMDRHRNVLSHEIERWDRLGESYVWVRIPELSSAVQITAFWGKGMDNKIEPTDIEGLKLWLKADAGVETSGTAVTRWLDQSGQGLVATQPVASLQPQWVENVDALGGRPTLRFTDAADDGVGFDAMDLGIAENQDRTLFMVIIPEGGHQNSEILGTSTQNMLDAGTYSTTDRLRFRDGTNHLYGDEGSLVYGHPHIVACSGHDSASRVTLWIDGKLSSSINDTVSSTFGWHMNALKVGLSSQSYRSYKGDLAELLVFDRALTEDERQYMEDYLASKYQLESGEALAALPDYAENGTTWSERYAGVLHMNGENGVAIDSAKRSDPAVAGAGITQKVEGLVGRASSFGGKNAPGVYPLISDSEPMSADGFTVSAWVRSNDYDTAYGGELSPRGNIFNVRAEDGSSVYSLYLSNVDGEHRIQLTNRLESGTVSSSAQAWSPGTWYHVAVTHDSASSVQRIFVNGVEVGTGSQNWTTGLTKMALIGNEIGTYYYFDGLLDEVRFSDHARSADWIHAHWLNTAPSRNFASYSAVQPARQDSDADGILDEWEYRYSGTATGIVAMEDSDGDGIINLHEFIMDSPPSQQNAQFLIESLSRAPETMLTFGPTSDRRTYHVEYSTTLLDGSWQELQESMVGTGSSLSIEDVTQDTKRFYRVRVQVP